MQLNRHIPAYTHEGGKATRALSPLQQLRRSVMACMLWEDNFYESGESIGNRIKNLVPKVDPLECSKLVVSAREDGKLRHAPLLVAREMARHPGHKRYVSRLLQRIITRPDMLAEFLALYWAGEETKQNKSPLSLKVRDGLRRCFDNFTEYQFAKYDRDTPIKLRDVMFLVRPKPKDDEQAALFKRIANRELKTPDTWEVALSGGGDKREVFTRLMAEQKLGALAFLRNLRNMFDAGIGAGVLTAYAHQLDDVAVKQLLPFQIIAAFLNSAPELHFMLSGLLNRTLGDAQRLAGRTIVLVDVSGSMSGQLSKKGTMTYYDAAAALAIILKGVCDKALVLSFSNQVVEVPQMGLQLHAAIKESQPNGGTDLAAAIRTINQKLDYDRLVVITDEQTHDGMAAPKGNTKSYLINVANCQNGVGYGRWVHVDGFSAATVDYIREYEASKYDS